MARKERKLSGFNAVGEEEVTGQQLVTSDDNANVNADVNNNTNNNVNSEEADEFDTLLKGEPTRSRVLRGIYFDDDLVRVIDKLSKGKPRGAKSDLVNLAVRKSFKEKGYI